MASAEIIPSGPFSLRLSARHVGDATRRFVDGVLTATVATASGLERVRAWQRPDGVVCICADSDDAVAQARFMLALEADHSAFLTRFADDPLLREPVRRLRGLRPLRTATVAHALLRAFTGQLIEAKLARSIERRIIGAATGQLDGLHASPTTAELARFSPAELQRLGLGARRAAALIRICRSLDLETLKTQPTELVARRLERERGVGPWSVGVVCLEGLGRVERGLARDLGLVKLASELAGKRLEPEQSDALLAPYGEWAGVASVYLLAGYHAGLVGLSHAHRNSGHRQDRRVAPRRAA
jgi:3-methyladenine DNA glycosylase/8-oxoguanine DNA glycosylase